MIAILYLQTIARGDLVVDSWLLSSSIHDYTPGHDPQEFVSFYSVQNPFQIAHEVTLGQSHVGTSYDFVWTGDSAHFDVQTNHYLEQLNGDTTTEGSIYIRPAVDTNIILSGSWQFSWPGNVLGQTIISLFAYDVDADQLVALANAGGGNTGLGPPYGDLHVQNNGVLQGGGHYQIYYVAQIYHSTSTPPGTHGQGTGEIHFTLTPVPEPATLGLIVFAVLIPRRRTGDASRRASAALGPEPQR